MEKTLILIFFVFILLTVTDEELQRLRLAFKRASGVSGLMSEPLFAREVLGDCVPVRVAEVISSYFEFNHRQFSMLCRTFKNSFTFTYPAYLLLYLSANLHCIWRNDKRDKFWQFAVRTGFIDKRNSRRKDKMFVSF